MRSAAHRTETKGNRVHTNAVQKVVAAFLVLFLLVFPKGGFKVAGVPITWGYLALGVLALWLPFALARGRMESVAGVRLLILALLVPFQVVSWLALLANGTSGIGFAISFVVTFFFLPLVLVLVLGVHLDRIHLPFLFRMIRLAVLAVAVYGIFLFIYKLTTGSFIEIPYLTVNSGDLGTLEDKYIDRGGVFKLISTYNNGNIYGVSILMLLPLYTWLERNVLRTTIVKLSLVLTLSRTVWVGLIAYELLQRLYVRRASFRTVFLLFSSLVLVGVGVWYSLDLIGVDVSFLFDRRLGGRIGQWRELDQTTLLPQVRFVSILEIVYLSVLHNFGVLGLAFFLLGMTAPLVLHLLGCTPMGRTEYKRSLAAGIAVYLFVAMSDGAILYIPVMAIYWFLVSLLLSDNGSFVTGTAHPVERLTSRIGASRSRRRTAWTEQVA